MLCLQPKHTRRRGAVAPLMAIMLVFIMGLLALSVDLGYIALVRNELQNAADAAALAGTSQLLDKSLLEGGDTTTALENARTEAYNFAHNNTAGGVVMSPFLNASNTTSGDIILGYLEFPLQNLADPNDIRSTYQAGQPGYFYLTPPAGALYNALRIRVYRDSNHTSANNGPLNLFFAKALGTGTKDMKATATACIQGGVLGFKVTTPGRNRVDLLPYALDIDVWNSQIVNCNGQDNWTRTTPTAACSPPSNVTAGVDSVHETKLFPAVNNSGQAGGVTGGGGPPGGGGGGGGVVPGNFGQVDIGSSNNSTSDVQRQILDGCNAADLGWFCAAHGYPDGFKMCVDGSSPTGYSMILQGDTGISAGVANDLRAIIGQPRIIPLYCQVTQNGNNAQFKIVKFVGITICEVQLDGSNTIKHITIQPCFVLEPNIVPGGTSEVSEYAVKPIALVR